MQTNRPFSIWNKRCMPWMRQPSTCDCPYSPRLDSLQQKCHQAARSVGSLGQHIHLHPYLQGRASGWQRLWICWNVDRDTGMICDQIILFSARAYPYRPGVLAFPGSETTACMRRWMCGNPGGPFAAFLVERWFEQSIF